MLVYGLNPELPQWKEFMAEFRKFETGATRDQDTTKHDPEGFLNPLVIDCFNEYMHKNRVQKDGSTRDSDNWQKGIPIPAYMKSMWRHFHDVWLWNRGYKQKMKEPIKVALCGLMFNVMGMLLEVMKQEERDLAGYPLLGPQPIEASSQELLSPDHNPYQSHPNPQR